MQNALLGLYGSLQSITNNEEGQDLIEYGLLCTLIALSMIAGIHDIAVAVGAIFTNVSSSLA